MEPSQLLSVAAKLKCQFKKLQAEADEKKRAEFREAKKQQLNYRLQRESKNNTEAMGDDKKFGN